MKLFFPKKDKRKRGMVAISPMGKQNMRTPSTDPQIDQAINDLHADITVGKKGIPESEKEKIRKTKRYMPSAIEQHQAEIKLEQSLFRGWDLPDWKIDEHNWSQGREMRMADYTSLFKAVTENNLQTVQDLTRINEQTRQMILSRVISKPTYLKLIRVCAEVQRSAPSQAGIMRNQFIHDRLQKVFNL